MSVESSLSEFKETEGKESFELQHSKCLKVNLSGETITDVLVTATGARVWQSPRLATRHTHGTGCTLASATAAGLAQGLGIESAVDRARAYVQRAIASAPGLGRGHGPLDHAHPLRSYPAPNG